MQRLDCVAWVLRSPPSIASSSAYFRYPRDGRFIESLYLYNPLVEPAEVKVDAERAQAWIKTGAQPTDTVKRLLKQAGVL